MVKFKTIVITVVAAVIGIAAFMVFSQSEEAKIKKQFKVLSEQFTKKRSESKLTSAAKAKRIKRLFAKTIGLQIPQYSIAKELDRRDLPAYILVGRAKFSEVKLKFHDIMIDFQTSDKAKVSVTATLVGGIETNEHIDEVHELECVLDKVEEDWFFRRIEVVEVLKR